MSPEHKPEQTTDQNPARQGCLSKLLIPALLLTTATLATLESLELWSLENALYSLPWFTLFGALTGYWIADSINGQKKDHKSIFGITAINAIAIGLLGFVVGGFNEREIINSCLALPVVLSFFAVIIKKYNQYLSSKQG